MKRCSETAYARCLNRSYCNSLEEAVYMEGSDCDRFNQQMAGLIGYEIVLIRGEIIGQLPSGQKRIHLLATDTDGICFYTDERSIIRVENPATNADKIRIMTDEELAQVISCPDGMADIPCRGEGISCTTCCLRWLKQPLEESTWNIK